MIQGDLGVQGEGIAFFLLAALGAASVMATFTAALGVATVGTVYGIASMSGRMDRLGGPTADGRRRVRGSIPGYTSVDFGSERYYRPQWPMATAYADAHSAPLGAGGHPTTEHLHRD